MGFFNGGGASLTFGDTRDPNSWPQYGQRWRGGQIVEVLDVMPQTDMKTKEPIVRNGKVAEQLPVVLLCDGSGPAQGMGTDERNPQDQTDIGRRTVYIKGSLRFSVGDALRAVQADDIAVGGYLFMMWTGMGKSGNSDFIGRTWNVHYIKPTGVFLNSVSHGAPGFQNQAPAAAPNQGAMPVQQNAQGPFAPQHTGFVPTQQPVSAPNPYGQQGAPVPPQAPPAAQWGAPPAQQQASPQGNPYGFGHNPAGSPGQQAYANAGFPADAQQPVPSPQSPAEGSNPWGAAPEQPNAPQAPYGPPQGTPQPGAPNAGNPWQQ